MDTTNDQVTTIPIPKTPNVGPNCSALISDANGLIYVAGHCTIYTVDHTHTLTRFAGSEGLLTGHKNGPRLEATFNDIMALCWLASGRLLVACYAERRIRLIENDMVTVLAGPGKHACLDGDFETACFESPVGLACLVPDALVAVTEQNEAVRLLNMKEKRVTTLKVNYSHSMHWWAISATITPNKCLLGSSHCIAEVDIVTGDVRMLASGDQLYDVRCVTQTADGRVLFCNTENNSLCELVGDKAIPIEQTKDLKMKLPISMTVAPNGDLWWFEYPGELKHMPNTRFQALIPAHPTANEQRFCLDFSPFFGHFSEDFANPFSDLTVIHTASGHTLSFYSEFLKAIHLDPLVVEQVCSASTLDFEVLRASLLLVSGTALPDCRTHATIWMSAIHLYKRLGATEVATWLESTICCQNFKHAEPSTLLEYLSSSKDIDPNDPPCLDSLNYYLACDKGTVLDAKNVKPIPECFMIAPDPKKLLNPWLYIQKCISSLLKSDRKDMTTDFSILASGGSVVSNFISVNKWVLYSRWPYFKRLIESGLEEATASRAELPSDFPARLLPHLLNYLYSGEVPDPTKISLSAASISFVLENAAQYHWTDMDDQVLPAFEPWMSCFKSL